jgi:hypothetical protein
MVEPVSVADQLVRLSTAAAPAAVTRDVSLLACWTQQTRLFVVFRSQMLPMPDQRVGIVCDLTRLPLSDADAAAYEFYAFEMVEPHHYPYKYSDDDDAVHWRLAYAERLPGELEDLLRTLSTVKDIGDAMKRGTANKAAITVAFLAASVFAGCANTTDRAETSTYGSASASPSLAKTKYEYAASDVEATVDGTPVQLRAFPFSVGAKTSTSPLTSALGDGCSANGTEVRGQFVVVQRGGCTFEQKYEVAQQAGAAGLVITSSGPLPDGRWQTPPIDLTAIPMLVADESTTVRLLAEGRTLTVRFDASVNETPAE